MTEPLPVRLAGDGRVATWNPGLSRAGRVVVAVRLPDGRLEERFSVNNGRVRVREGERIERVCPAP